MKRALVLRGAEDAERTAARLRDMGFAPIVSPVIAFARLDAPAPDESFDATLVTSAKGVEFAQGRPAAAPLHVVGARTAEVARSLGWRPDLVAGNARALLPLLRERYREPARFLYLAGRDRQTELEEGLRAAGHTVRALEVYEARAARRLSEEAVRALRSGDVAAVLHYSKRSVEIFLALAERGGVLDRLGACAHLALSDEVAAPLAALGLSPQVGAKPDEAHLLELLEE